MIFKRPYIMFILLACLAPESCDYGWQYAYNPEWRITGTVTSGSLGIDGKINEKYREDIYGGDVGSRGWNSIGLSDECINMGMQLYYEFSINFTAGGCEIYINNGFQFFYQLTKIPPQTPTDCPLREREVVDTPTWTPYNTEEMRNREYFRCSFTDTWSSEQPIELSATTKHYTITTYYQQEAIHDDDGSCKSGKFVWPIRIVATMNVCRSEDVKKESEAWRARNPFGSDALFQTGSISRYEWKDCTEDIKIGTMVIDLEIKFERWVKGDKYNET